MSAAKSVQQWIAIRNWMTDDEREILTSMALEHLNDASRELRLFAHVELTRGLDVQGNRILNGLIDPNVKLKMMTEMRRVPVVASVVICLWADARNELLEILIQKATAAGYAFAQNWNWEQARRGYYDDKDLTQFASWANANVPNTIEIHPFENRLLVLWLSRALLREPDISPQGDMKVEQSQTDESSADVALSPTELAIEALRSILPAKKRQQLDNTMMQLETVSSIGNAEQLDDMTPIPAAEFQMESGEQVVAPGDDLLPITQLYQDLQTQYDQVRQTHERVIFHARQLLSSVETANLLEVQKLHSTLSNLIQIWENALKGWSDTLPQASQRVNQELEWRTDLDIVRLLPQTVVEADQVLSAFEQILEYDRQKQQVLTELHSNNAKITELWKELSAWGDKGTYQETLSPSFRLEEEKDLILSQARSALKNTELEIRRLSEQQAQLRESSLYRIANTLQSLHELNWDGQTVIFDEKTLSQLEQESLTEYSNQRLRLLESTLTTYLDEQIIKAQQTHGDEVAIALTKMWNDNDLVELLGHLVACKREVDAVLLLMAANRTHPRSQELTLSSDVLRGLLIGIDQLAPKNAPFKFLNDIGPELFNGIKVDEPLIWAELCLVLLAASYGGSRRIQSEFYWVYKTTA